MLKRFLLVALALSIPTLARAQVVFDPNIIFSVGALAKVGTLDPGAHRFQVAITTGLPGIKLASSFLGGSWYTLGPGMNLQTVDVATGSIAGIALDLSGVTYHPSGGQFAIQAILARDITGVTKSTSVLLTVGASLVAPKLIQARREARHAEKEHLRQLRLAHPELFPPSN
jgi:hypothetical protein